MTMLRVWILAVAVFGLGAAARAGTADEAIDLEMDADPDIPKARVVKVFSPRLIPLWLQALDRPEADLKYQAATTIALAHRRGMPGLSATVEPLLRAIDQPGQHATVRLAAAQALITLDARDAAKSLFAHSQADGVEMRNLVEPALAVWDFEPARAVWLERTNHTGLPRRSDLLAIRALGQVREAKAAPRLRELAASPGTDPIVRLEAAKSLGTIQRSGLEPLAEQIAGEKETAAQLVAASLLRHHRGDVVATIQQRLAVEAGPAAAAVALDGLLDGDPGRVLPLIPTLLANSDAEVRAKAVEAFRRKLPLQDVPAVAGLLDDPHPKVRVSARKSLREAAAQHGSAVRQEAMRAVAADRWRALEQAAILLGQLGHKPAGQRLVELLRFDRPEVFVAAAWALRKLAIPETLPDQLREIDRRWQEAEKFNAAAPREMIDLEVSQLAQSLGRAKYTDAAPVLARFIPKLARIGPLARVAAIWALSLIQPVPPPGLVRELIGRVTDDATMMPEDLRVRRMSAVALGRLRADTALPALRKYYPKRLTTDGFSNACGWALERITGEPLPRTGVTEVAQTGWFLEPND
ncbi:MAG: hypothetical protein ACJ8F7_21820 [Gemmataceae bacterium]